MSEEAQLQMQLRSIQSCRLCLAPDNECISIFNSYAADKEPISSKIYNCVGIKITSDDHFSSRICHACVSYLNSWQSFKNRCLASQNKQSDWLNQATNSTQSQQQHQQSQSQQDAAQQRIRSGSEQSQSHIASSILDGISTLKKRKSLTVYVSPKEQLQQKPLPLLQTLNKPYTATSATQPQQQQQQATLTTPAGQKRRKRQMIVATQPQSQQKLQEAFFKLQQSLEATLPTVAKPIVEQQQQQPALQQQQHEQQQQQCDALNLTIAKPLPLPLPLPVQQPLRSFRRYIFQGNVS